MPRIPHRKACRAQRLALCYAHDHYSFSRCGDGTAWLGLNKTAGSQLGKWRPSQVEIILDPRRAPFIMTHSHGLASIFVLLSLTASDCT